MSLPWLSSLACVVSIPYKVIYQKVAKMLNPLLHPCSQVENVDCMEDNHIKFDFLGKDSIRYENEVQVNPRVYDLVQEFCRKDEKGKRESPMAQTLSKRLSSVVTVFRAALHSCCMQHPSEAACRKPLPVCSSGIARTVSHYMCICHVQEEIPPLQCVEAMVILWLQGRSRRTSSSRPWTLRM